MGGGEVGGRVVGGGEVVGDGHWEGNLQKIMENIFLNRKLEKTTLYQLS